MISAASSIEDPIDDPLDPDDTSDLGTIRPPTSTPPPCDNNNADGCFRPSATTGASVDPQLFEPLYEGAQSESVVQFVQ